MMNQRHAFGFGFYGFLLLGAVYGGIASAQSTSSYGDIVVPAGSSGIVATRPLDAGGADDSAQFVSGCVGFINAELPDLTVTVQSPVPELVVSVRSAADTTLLVRKPDGTIHCDDDTEGLNPALRLPKASAGSYEVWVGVIEQVFAPAEVDVAVGASAALSLAPPPTAQPAALAATAVDRRLEIELPAGSPAGPFVAGLVDAVEAVRLRLSEQVGQDIRLSTSGPVVVEDAGDGIVLTLRGLELAHDAGIVRFGDISVSVSDPGAEVIYWSIDGLPKVTFIEGGALAGTISAGLVRIAGRYDRALRTHLGYDIDLRDIALIEAEGGPLATLKRVRIAMDLGKDASGTVGGPMLFELRGIRVEDPDGAISIGRIGLETRVRALNLASLGGANITGLADPGQGAAAALEIAGRVLGAGIGSSDTDLFVEDLRAHVPDGAPLRIGALGLQIGYGATGELAELRLGASMADLDLDHPEIPDALRRGSVEIRLGLENLPLVAMASAVGGLGPIDEAQQSQIAQAVLGVLLQANPSLRLDSLNINVGDLVVSSLGRLGMSSSMTPEGQFDVVIRGLSALIDEARTEGAAAGGMLGQDVLPLLEFARSIGTADAGANPDRLTYRIDVTPEMKVLVNGIDLSQMQ